jgi:hypothetical protein
MSSKRRLLIFRCSAWFCVFLIAYLSLIPQDLEMRPPRPQVLSTPLPMGLLLVSWSWPTLSARNADHCGTFSLQLPHGVLTGLLSRSAPWA